MSEDAEPSALELAQAAAARLARGEWQLDVEPLAEVEEPPPPVEEKPAAVEPRRSPATLLFPSTTPETEAPPPAERILEAMLFAGGPPLTAEKAAAAIRGFTPEAFRETVDRLAKLYRAQRRPYAVRPKGDGFVLALRPEFRAVRERLFGGPKEARLTPAALDVLSLVAYRQPVTKAEVDALRGADSGGALRQLVRLGLIAVARRAEGAGYATTPRFLEMFGLTSPDELPRLVDS